MGMLTNPNFIYGALSAVSNLLGALSGFSAFAHTEDFLRRWQKRAKAENYYSGTGPVDLADAMKFHNAANDYSNLRLSEVPDYSKLFSGFGR
jgi:hypothetical protein